MTHRMAARGTGGGSSVEARVPTNQSILVSGESGAGREDGCNATTIELSYLTVLSDAWSPEEDARITPQVLQHPQ